MAAEEVTEKVQKVDIVRNQEHPKKECMEREIRWDMLDDLSVVLSYLYSSLWNQYTEIEYHLDAIANNKYRTK